MGHKNSKSSFDVNMAKKLVKLCLSNDILYGKYLTPILKLDDSNFEELFIGNSDINYNIGTKEEFMHLVLKFEDYNKIMYNFYKDKSKHKDLSNLWKGNISIISLCDLSYNELTRKLDNMLISTNFKYELINLLRKTTESQSESIFGYLQNKGSYIYHLLSFAKNEEKSLNINSEGNSQNCNQSYISNLHGIFEKIITCSLPFIKEYLNGLENLDPLSKNELKKDMKINSKLKNMILKMFEKKNSNSYIHTKLLDLINDFKYKETIENLFENAKNKVFCNPLFNICYLALSFLNLIDNIKSYTNTINEYKNKRKIFSRELSNIFSDFERHRDELNILDLDNTKESLEKIREIHSKIYSDKMRLANLINQIKTNISNKKNQKKKNGIDIAIGCVGILVGIVGLAFPSGIGYKLCAGGGVLLNSVSICYKSKEIVEINKELDAYIKMYNQGLEKEKEIDNLLREIEKKYNI